jgi:hypothetical protein
MAEPTCPPSEWVGQDVHLECKAGAETRTNDCTPDGVNDRGVYVSEGGRNYFYPWINVVRIGLGPKPGTGTRTMRVR